ncbi:MAG: alpha/beta hydrolase [Deferrisomatales bacterium]
MLEVLAGRVAVEPDRVYGAGGGRALRCDLYHPPGGGSSRPAALLLHGGGWAEGDKGQLGGYGVQLARRGVVAVACEYRLSGEAPWPAQLDDVVAALGWVIDQAGELGVDPARVALVGASAGGHLALLAAAGENAGVAAVVALYPPVRLDRPELSATVRQLFGREPDREALERASPLYRVTAAFPPTLLLHGTGDDVVPWEDSAELHGALRRAGVDAELELFEGQPHAFDTDPALGRRCVERMVKFLGRQ